MARLRSPYTLRAAGPADAALVAYHRAAMFRDMGQVGPADMAALESASQAYLTPSLARGEYLGWLVEHEGEVVAGGGLVVHELLPRPGYLAGGSEAYVLNVYCEPAHRRRGLARALMKTILDWCRERRIARISLHASDEGRPLYDSLGFAATNEMRLELADG
jgi:GNAT superfamily N-acetyltransferase